MNKIRIGIVGGAGYTGGELIRLLLNHPAAEIAFVQSKSNAGKLLSHVHGDLLSETDLSFSEEVTSDADVVFLCVGHGEARTYLESQAFGNNTKIIDLSQDFRLEAKSSVGARNFVYGLPEVNREAIKAAQNIANPGCFATALQLGLLPLAAAGLLQQVFSTGITGSTGAGQSLASSSHFSWRANNIQPYKVLTHQHMKEVSQTLAGLKGSSDFMINFVPWRGDFTRGIFISSQVPCTESIDELLRRYQEFFAGHPFVTISEAPIFLKQVVNTNNCFIQLEKVDDMLVVHAIIDNLLKGASGQAIQNMNLMFGLAEETGLKLKAGYF
jgi:N-acetyl-gamma-glutamyl-phosphate reductase